MGTYWSINAGSRGPRPTAAQVAAFVGDLLGPASATAGPLYVLSGRLGMARGQDLHHELRGVLCSRSEDVRWLHDPRAPGALGAGPTEFGFTRRDLAMEPVASDLVVRHAGTDRDGALAAVGGGRDESEDLCVLFHAGALDPRSERPDAAEVLEASVIASVEPHLQIRLRPDEPLQLLTVGDNQSLSWALAPTLDPLDGDTFSYRTHFSVDFSGGKAEEALRHAVEAALPTFARHLGPDHQLGYFCA